MNDMRSTKAFGASSFDVIEHGRQALLQRLGAEMQTQPNYTWQAYGDFAASFVFERIARPMAVGVSSLAVALGGWVVAVNAASSSVPGDALYPIKIATERVQLRLTTSSEQRTKLHMDFAGRRLQEVKEVQASDRSGKSVRVQSALQSFRKEMASVKSEVENVSQKDPASASKIAEYVDQKTDEYTDQLRNRVVREEDIQTSDASREEAEGAQTETVAVNQDAARVLVDHQETDQLQNLFRNDLNDIQGQLAMIRSRLDVVKKVLANRTDLDLALRENSQELISRIGQRLVTVQPQIDEATNQLAVGGYRSTFETMGSLKDTMSVVHNLLAQLEVQISVALADMAPGGE